MRSKKIVHSKTTTRTVSDVYTIRDSRGYPLKSVLTLSLRDYRYCKKVLLEFAKMQDMMGWIIDIQNPEKSVKGTKIRIVETMVVEE